MWSLQVTRPRTGDRGIYLREPFQLERPNRLGVSVDAKFHEDAGMHAYGSLAIPTIPLCIDQSLLLMLTTNSHAPPPPPPPPPHAHDNTDP